MDRWFLCSQWAGRWAMRSAETVAGYAKGLSSCAKAVGALLDPDAATKHLREYVEAEVKALEV